MYIIFSKCTVELHNCHKRFHPIPLDPYHSFPIVFPLLPSYLSQYDTPYELLGRVANLISRYAISIYEAATLWYALIYPPDTSKFDVIRKASVGDGYSGAK